MKRVALAVALAALPAAAAAQQTAAQQSGARQRTAAQTAASTDAAVGALRQNWQQVSRYLAQTAEDFSEADYAYKPVATVRSVGEMLGHVAGAQFMMCAAALGEPPREEDAVERAAKTKAALVKALKESNDYCARAYAQTDAAATGSAQLFGQSMTRLGALALNAVHDGEHYGNLVTYMRMKGMVPPSSRLIPPAVPPSGLPGPHGVRG